MYVLRLTNLRFHVACVSLVFIGLMAACQTQPSANVTTNSAAANANIASTTNSNSSSVPESVAINAREPEKYRAMLVFTAQTTGGDQAIAIPQLSADVARNSSDHRLSFNVPNGEQVIWLDSGGKHYIVLPKRKQYVELTPEATGFQIGSLMTPGQLVSYLSTLKGYELVGEEQINGRTAQKYRYSATTSTKTQAGDVKTETFVYIDKETGLPLHADLASDASGDVQGVKGLRVSFDMRDIQTDIDPSMFKVPPDGYSQVQPEQVRQQVNAITSAVTAVLGGLLRSMNTTSSATSTTTTTTTNSSSGPTASPSAGTGNTP